MKLAQKKRGNEQQTREDKGGTEREVREAVMWREKKHARRQRRAKQKSCKKMYNKKNK